MIDNNCNIKCPKIIKKHALYQKTIEFSTCLTILKAQWRLFGHILRQAINTPHNTAMIKYFKFKTKESKQQGRPKTSIIATPRQDLMGHNSDHWPTRLHSITSTNLET